MTRHTAFIENWSRAVSLAVLGAFGAWMLVAWAWPLCGPWLLDPCPLPTPIGCKVALGVGALYGLAKAIEMDIAARRYRPLPLPRARRPVQSMAVVGCATRVNPADFKHPADLLPHTPKVKP